MKTLAFLLSLCMLFTFSGCSAAPEPAAIAATTLPVYEFTRRLCEGTGITVTRLVTENVSCLHDYTLQVSQMQAIEGAELVIINGAGLEEFLKDALTSAHHTVDASASLSLMDGHDHEQAHGHEHEEDGHVHAEDPHIWLAPKNAKIMAGNICAELCRHYPQHEDIFQRNLTLLLADLDALQRYGEEKLSSLSCRELVTFHDGFSYFAEAFGLTILEAVEEESGSEASAAELIELIQIVQEHKLPAVFTEINSSVSAAEIIAAESGVKVYQLDMAMAGNSYFDSMYHNIDTIWEAMQ